jgi:hypothetical protein
VPTDLRIFHDMIALLQENKMTNEKFQFQRTLSLSDMTNRKHHFRERRRRGKSIDSAQGNFYAKPC